MSRAPDPEAPITIDCQYLEAGFAAAYLIRSGGEWAFIDNNTAHAVPRLLEALKLAGGKPESVRYVIVTHVHLDHAGGTGQLLAHCPRAMVLCHPRAARHLSDPSRLEASARQVYGIETFEKLYGPRLEPIDPARIKSLVDDEVIEFGQRKLRFLHTRGHANHHVCVFDESRGEIFTGDSFGLCYPGLQQPGKGRLIFPSTSPTDFDPAAAIETVHRIARSGAHVAYPTHFGAVERLVEGARDLEKDLRVSGEWLERARAALQSGRDRTAVRDEVLADLIAHMKERVTDCGLKLTSAQWAMLKLDLDLNADGIVFAAGRPPAA